jgi:hypothetical protein
VKLSRSLAEIRIACDVVAIKDRPRLVSANLHRAPFPLPRTNKVSHGTAPEVVPRHPDQPDFLTGSQPCFSVSYPRQRFDALNLFAHQRDQLRCEIAAPIEGRTVKDMVLELLEQHLKEMEKKGLLPKGK